MGSWKQAFVIVHLGLSMLCVVTRDVPVAFQASGFPGGTRVEKHIIFTAISAIRAKMRHPAIFLFGGVPPKCAQEVRRLPALGPSSAR